MKTWSLDLFNNLDNSNLIDFEKMKHEALTSLEEFATNVTTTLPQNILGFISGLFSGLGVFVLGLIIGFIFDFYDVIEDRRLETEEEEIPV